MEGTGGEALLRLLGLHAETVNIRNVGPRSELAGPYAHPDPHFGKTFGRIEYWKPFLQLAVIAIQQTAQAVPRRRDGDSEPLRDLALPIVNREWTDIIVELVKSSEAGHQAHALYGLPGSGRYTLCDQALARVTPQNRHIVRVDEPLTYHRDLLDMLETYGIHADSWSLAACEREFRRLVENAPSSLGGVILHGGKTADQFAHLLPRRPRTHLLLTTERPSKSRMDHVYELDAPSFMPEEAVTLLAFGHQNAEPRDLSLLAEQLYRHVGLIAVAARSRITVATLIRRLRRNRTATVLQLASLGGMDLRRYARQVIRDIGDDADALFALDVALWLTGNDSWNLYHAVGFLLPGRVSPARVNVALDRFNNACGYVSYWGSSPLVPILRQLRAEQMTPLLHALASLEGHERIGLNGDRWPVALSVWRRSGETPPVLNMGTYETSVTVCHATGGGHDFAALFHGPDGRPHAQLYEWAHLGERTLEVYEDGEQLPQSILLDPDNDTRWPEVTRYMLGLLTGPDLSRLSELVGDIRVDYYAEPDYEDLHPEIELEWIDLDDITPEMATMWDSRPDESSDPHSGEIFG
nr:hypothetical protein GCM10025730_38220 [Promicromonospora thailandica]